MSVVDDSILKANYQTKITVPYADIDMLGHVNNARYLTYFEIVRTEAIYSHRAMSDPKSIGIIIARAEIDYKSPARWRDELTVKMRTSHVGNSSWTSDYEITNEKENNKLVATGKTVQVAFDYAKGKPVPIPQELKTKLLKEVEESRE